MNTTPLCLLNVHQCDSAPETAQGRQWVLTFPNRCCRLICLFPSAVVSDSFSVSAFEKSKEEFLSLILLRVLLPCCYIPFAVFTLLCSHNHVTIAILFLAVFNLSCSSNHVIISMLCLFILTCSHSRGINSTPIFAMLLVALLLL